MSIGNRIYKLRKENNLSQEYIAEQLDVSRQAVSKWENGQSNPDTENLIRLAALFHVSVEYLSTGKAEVPPTAENIVRKRKQFQKKHFFTIIAVLFVCVVTVIVYKIHTLPVDWDAAACSGGYSTFNFDKNSEELVQKYLDGSGRKKEILSIQAIRGTQEAEWKDRTLYLHFDIQYDHSIKGKITERVTFIGHRVWFDTYKWDGAMING